MGNTGKMTLNEKTTADNYLKVIRQGIDIEEYEIALTAIENLKKMKVQGVEEWAEEEDRAGRCPKCGAQQYWFALECADCGEKMR